MESSVSVLDRVLEAFGSVAGWIGTAMQDLVPIFWDTGDNQLTFFGVLAVAGLAFSVIFLLLGIISGFLHFRG